MKRLKITLVSLFAICLFLPINPVFASPAKDHLKSTIDRMIEVLQDPQYQGDHTIGKRREALRVLVYERFDFLTMTKFCLGKHRAGRTQEEIEKLSKLFGQLLERTYVSSIEKYTNEKVVYTKDKIYPKKKKALVYTHIVTDSVKIPIDYKLHQVADGSWKVIDMKVEGVLISRNYREQFDQILRKKSFETLLEKLKEKLNS